VLENNRKGKQYYYDVLKKLNLEYVPTEANFLLIKLGPAAETITKKLFDKQVLVRFMAAYGLPDYIRVTIGTMEENTRFIETLKRLL